MKVTQLCCIIAVIPNLNLLVFQKLWLSWGFFLLLMFLCLQRNSGQKNSLLSFITKGKEDNFHASCMEISSLTQLN